MGIVGLGEASHAASDDETEVFAGKFVWPQIRGLGIESAREVVHDIFQDSLSMAGDSLSPFAGMSATEQALWDLEGRREGVPVYELLGGRRPSGIELYANVNRSGYSRSPEGFAAAAEEAVEAGFRAIKCAPFDGVSGPPWDSQLVERGLERVEAIRNTVGSGTSVMVDCHRRFDLDLSIVVAQELAKFDVSWLEEPMDGISGAKAFAELSANTDIPLAGGELLVGIDQHVAFIQSCRPSIAMPDVKFCGGLSVAVEVARAASKVGMAVAPHNPSGPVSTLASLHFGASIPNLMVLEYPFPEVPWRHSFSSGTEMIDNGRLIAPESPGLGVAVDTDVVKANWRSV